MSEKDGIWENCGLDGLDVRCCEDGLGGRSICKRGGPGVDLARGRVGVEGDVTVREGTLDAKWASVCEAELWRTTYDRHGMAHPTQAEGASHRPGIQPE